MSRWDVRDVIEWDVRNWRGALDFWEQHSSLDFSNCLALELASRNGGLSLWAALKGANVLCSDLNGPAENARVVHEKYGVSDLVRYEDIDARNIPYENHFDAILFKSALGGFGLHDDSDARKRSIEGMYRALKPGGELLFAENLAASPLHRFLRKRCLGWGRIWRYITVDEMREFVKPFSEFHYETCGFLGALGRTEKQRNVLAKFDRIIVDRIVPEDWRYIVFGLARK